MNTWQADSFFYHIYPIGALGAPRKNDFKSAAVNRIGRLGEWAGYLKNLGVNAVYLGPVFESSAHGYDTADFFKVDRRLGTNEDLKTTVATLKQNGIRVVLDAVLNHTGRDFFAFRDIIENGSLSRYVNWYKDINFAHRSGMNDNFSYGNWNGCNDLPLLNHENPEVRAYLFDAVKFWISEFNIDGIRLDAADSLPLWFMSELGGILRRAKPDIWLLGEVIHGDYRKWANITTLDSVTNYEFYKGLHSSHNDGNYFEAAHTLNRQFGPSGMYKDLLLYNFADNHDVNRISSVLNDPADIYPLHILMFMAPGIPSLYYGSEAQLKGVKARDNDFALRPEIDVEKFDNKNDLSVVIRKLWDIRKNNPALKYGNYSQIYVSPDVFAFCREYENKKTVVIVSRLAEKTKLRLDVKGISGSCVFVDALNGNEEFVSDNGRIVINDMWPKWGRVLVQKQGRA